MADHENSNEDKNMSSESASLIENRYDNLYPPETPSPLPPPYSDSITRPPRMFGDEDGNSSLNYSDGRTDHSSRMRMTTTTTLVRVSETPEISAIEKRSYKAECYNAIWLIAGFMWLGIVLLWILSIPYFATIIGIPIGLDIIRYTHLIQAAHGTNVRIRRAKTVSRKGCRVLKSILWFPCGLLMALFHIICGVVLCITLVGFHFGLKHLRLVKTSLCPFDIELEKAVKLHTETAQWDTNES
eukprot:CFRG8456T1